MNFQRSFSFCVGLSLWTHIKLDEFIPILDCVRRTTKDLGGILLKTNTPSGLQKGPKSAIYDTFCLASYLSCYMGTD